MADINFTVNTAPMAERIDGVKTNVGLVGAAVTAMQAAVIASEKKASDDICKSIDGGFYMLMRVRLSQRVAQFASTMQSRVGSMMETASSIDRTHRQMQGDFNRIKARYTKLFESLDKNLDSRVRELDREAMILAQRREELIVGKQCQEAPSSLYYAADTSRVALKAAGARLKCNAQDSIAELGEETRHIIEYGRETEAVLEEGASSGGAYVLAPVVYTVAENLAAEGNYALEIQVPDAFGPKTQASLAQGVRQRQDQLKDTSAQEMAAVRESFLGMVSRSGANPRVSQTMITLFDASFSQGAPAPGAAPAPAPAWNQTAGGAQ